MTSLRFTKGHGTGNDFVILTDPDARLDLGPDLVRWLCDRHRGIGGDGVLRVVRAERVPEWSGRGDVWFMDYRNADGSVAQMCGNGLRVFARHLATEGLIEGESADVATRAGLKHVDLLDDGRVRADLGPVRVRGDEALVRLDGATWTATPVDVGNPHAVVVCADEDELTGLDLGHEPGWDPAEAFPEGVNVEFVVLGEGPRARMRVHERGVGETLSCGTGTVAVAAALAARTGLEGPWTVEVPGGVVEVDLGPVGPHGRPAGLVGPAELVASGTARPPLDLLPVA